MRLFITLLCLLFTISCGWDSSRSGKPDKYNDDVPDGIVKHYDEQKRLIAEITYKNGLKHGLTRTYYSSGSISDEIFYEFGQKSGIAKKFHKNGNIYSITPYKEGYIGGIQKKYYSNGKIWSETPYFKGQPGIGLKEYSQLGKLRTNYPKIEVQKFFRNDKISLNFFLTNHSKNVKFYVTELMFDQYIPIKAKHIKTESGVARMEIFYKKGKPIDTTLSIVARHTTLSYNTYVTKRLYRIKTK